jgi:tetratricopeptide (TPR) repeat protein
VLATELLAAGQREEAMQQLRLAVPGAPRAHYSLGVELLEDGKVDEGIAELRAFIRDQPHLGLVVDAHEYIGKADAQRGRWPDAIAEFQAMLAIAPDNAEAKRLLAGAYFNANDMNDAIDAYQKYLAVKSNDTDALNQLGIALASKNRLDDAIAVFTRAEQTDPQDGAVERNFAYVLYQKHDVADALVHAEEAVALQPDDDASKALLQILRQER